MLSTRNAILSLIVATVCLLVYRSVVSGQIEFVLAFPAGVFAINLLVVDAKRIRAHRGLLLGMSVWVLVQPFLRIISTGWKLDVVLQSIGVMLFMFYFSLLTPQAQTNLLERCRPLLLPGILYFGIFGVSYVFSTTVKSDLAYWLELTSAYAFAFLACVYCENLADIRRCMKVLIGGGLLQFAVVLLQAIGIADKLPPAMSSILGTKDWGGVISSTTRLVRYPGSFGDIELLGEYIGLLLLLTIGVLVISKRLWLNWALVAGGLLSITGFATGTRAFVLGTAGGIVIMFAILSLLPGSKQLRLWRIPLVTVGLVLVLLVLVPDQLMAGFVDRLYEIEVTGANAINRGQVWDTIPALLPRMPLLGYGAQMLPVFRSTHRVLYESPHSLYLSMLLIAGFPGLLATLVLIAAPLFWSWRAMTLPASEPVRQLGCIFLAVTLYWAVNEAKIEFLRLPFYANILFFFFGLIVSTYVLARREAAK